MTDRYVSVTGGCYCEAIRYEANVMLREAFYCHCKICQKSSGAPAEIAVFVEPGTLSFTKAEPKFFQTSPIGRRGFCSACGSRLIWISQDQAELTLISIGSLDHPEHVVPVEHLSVESQLPWYKVSEELPHKRSEDDPDLIAAWSNAGLTHEGKPL